MSSLGASIPPELFEDILFYVGNEDRLKPCEDPTARREEMKHLSACALTCVYWAQLTRERMFGRLILRSSKDTSGLRSLLTHASPSDRIDPIGTFLERLVVYYKLGDLPWFHNVPGLVASGAYNLRRVAFHVLGPVPPAFTAGNTRRSVLHPLFFAVPRVMPMISFHKFTVKVYVKNIHFTHPTMLYNLLQDCKLLHPTKIVCRNLTWDHDPTATPSSLGWTLGHHSRPEYLYSLRCTDNALANIMALSVPRHEFSRKPHLNTNETSSLLDIIRTPCGQDASPYFGFRVISGFDDVRGHSDARLTPDCDLAFEWRHSLLSFFCVASRRPGDDSNIRYVTHVIIEPMYSGIPGFMEQLKTIDWVVFLRGVQAFPDLRGIIIYCDFWFTNKEEWRKCMVELAPLLREAWAGVDAVLQVIDWDRSQIPLSLVLQDIDRMKKEAPTHPPSNPEPTLKLESGPSDAHHDHTVSIASASPSASSGPSAE
ncbi:hypothetical protein BDY19DRAFT_541759 [Irpex rosettiformis]|uniref:Uncharacterized protein n=1 Tax=Irpex rosettiformis TaxID=378272 RepID=A0ACB8TQL6_9APHY|nr:hypothetical protein BDY19DRAFT_541759 [Irpex rosettiformis]